MFKMRRGFVPPDTSSVIERAELYFNMRASVLKEYFKIAFI